MKTTLDPLWNAVMPVWKQIKILFTEHHFITIICGFFVLLITLSFYRFLKSISPALNASAAESALDKRRPERRAPASR